MSFVIRMSQRLVPGRNRLWGWYVAIGCSLALLYAFVPPFAGNGPLINSLGLSSSVAIFVGMRLHRPTARTAWWLFILGQSLFFLGDLYTYSYPKLLGADVPFPSPGDAVYLTVYPVLMAGLVVLIRRRNPLGDRAGFIDSLILTVGFALLSWVVLIGPNLQLAGLSPIATGVSIAYPLGDIILLAAAIRLAVDSGKRAPAFYLLIASIVCLLVTDSVYTYALLIDAYHHQVVLDLGWIGYYLLWGAAALHPSMRTLEEPASVPRGRLTPLRLGMLTTACMIAPTIRFAQAIHSLDRLILIVASALMFLLVLARMVGLVRQEERSSTRERAVRSAGLALVRASSVDEVHTAALGAVRRLVGDHPSRLVLFDGSRSLRISETVDGVQVSELGVRGAGWLRENTSLHSNLCRPAIDVLEDLDLSFIAALDRWLLVVSPLWMRDEVRGFLVVSSPTDVSAEVIASLEAIGTQVSLAIEGTTAAAVRFHEEGDARLRSLVADSSDLIVVLDRDGLTEYLSPSIESVLGYSADELTGAPFERLVLKPDRQALARILGDGGATGRRVVECSLRHRDGTYLSFELRHRNLLEDDRVRGIVINARDVSERKAFENQLTHQAFHDPVTGLPNRALFADRVEHAIARGPRDRKAVGVMFIDLDDFKTINDSLGHASGDEVLRQVGVRLQAGLRETDTAARLGGDEFAVLMEGVVDDQAASYVAERILETLEPSITVDGKELFIKTSIGICIPEADAPIDAAELLRNADLAMYIAKRERKGSYQMFEPAMHERALDRLELRGDLQRALSTDGLEVHYQPVVRLDEASLYGVEALLRWPHPTRGSISPARFIPLAEESGLIVPIGRWVLNQACAQATELHRSFPEASAMKISVNLSIKQLQSETIVDDVRGALHRAGLAADRLVLEITESVMMADTELALLRLHALKELGVQLAMDDFGTGYSSLSYLSQFPVDILKMDRSFLSTDPKQSDLAAAIVGLGSSLHLDVVAEGVETREQTQALVDLGCEFGQGFLFARPMDHVALRSYVSNATIHRSPGEQHDQAA